MSIDIDKKKYLIEEIPFTYRWTPYSVEFEGSVEGMPITIAFHFAEEKPIAEMILTVDPSGKNIESIIPKLKIATVLRTCHTFAWRHPDIHQSKISGQTAILSYPYTDTDSACVVFWSDVEESQWKFLSNEQSEPYRNSTWLEGEFPKEPQVSEKLAWKWHFGSGEKKELLNPITRDQYDNIKNYEEKLLEYGLEHNFELEDSSLIETTVWSRVMLKALQHPLDGEYVPMPCPAQYNFYFTHDALVTDLSAVFFDLDRVKLDLDYIRSKAKTDSIIPHAYYWKDGEYRTEYCGPENWNHYWFIQVVSAYLKHGGDPEYVAELIPLLDKSIKLILSNEGPDGLIHGKGPDWWDAGKVPGARSYHTSLAIRTLREYLFTHIRLENEAKIEPGLIEAYKRLQKNLNDKLWDDEKKYLMNNIGDVQDEHYYCGSLVAAWFGHLKKDQRLALINTAKNELLDPHLGIRVAMPPDFHLLKDEYKFNGMEMGEPYMYFNGAVWPNSTAWYINAQIRNELIDDALQSLKSYMTLDGIKESPNGQASFYEFRYTNPDSPDYGEIYKPNFLWAGSWYLYSLYGLVGVRENAENISIHTDIPWDSNVEYRIEYGKNDPFISFMGDGKTASQIRVDGKEFYSCVLYGNPKKIEIERGNPTHPYLENSNTIIENVSYKESMLNISYITLEQDEMSFVIISPIPAKSARTDDKSLDIVNEILKESQGFRIIVKGVSNNTNGVRVYF